MGYSHSWNNGLWVQNSMLDKKALETALKIFRIVENSDVFGQFIRIDEMADPDEWSGMQDRGTEIFLNGYSSSDGKIDLGHEPIYFSIDEPRGGSLFCKTNRKPYDLSVTVTLALLEMAGVINNTDSDSGVKNLSRNWKEAIAYSVEECLRGFKSNPDCKKLGYKFPTVEEAHRAFEKVQTEASEYLLSQREPNLAPEHEWF